MLLDAGYLSSSWPCAWAEWSKVKGFDNLCSAVWRSRIFARQGHIFVKLDCIPGALRIKSAVLYLIDRLNDIEMVWNLI